MLVEVLPWTCVSKSVCFQRQKESIMFVTGLRRGGVSGMRRSEKRSHGVQQSSWRSFVSAPPASAITAMLLLFLASAMPSTRVDRRQDSQQQQTAFSLSASFRAPLLSAAADTTGHSTSLLGDVVVTKVKIPNPQLHRQRVGLSPAARLFNGEDLDMGDEEAELVEEGYFADDDAESADVAVPQEEKTKTFKQSRGGLMNRLGVPFLLLGQTGGSHHKKKEGVVREEAVLVRVPEERSAEEKSWTSEDEEVSTVAALLSVGKVPKTLSKRLRGGSQEDTSEESTTEAEKKEEAVVSSKRFRGTVASQMRENSASNAAFPREHYQRHRLEEVVIIPKRSSATAFLQSGSTDSDDSEDSAPSYSAYLDEEASSSDEEAVVTSSGKKQYLRNVAAQLLVLPVFQEKKQTYSQADGTSEENAPVTENSRSSSSNSRQRVRSIGSSADTTTIHEASVPHASPASQRQPSSAALATSSAQQQKLRKGLSKARPSAAVAREQRKDDGTQGRKGRESGTTALLEDALLQHNLQQPLPSLTRPSPANPSSTTSSSSSSSLSQLQQRTNGLRRVV